MDGVAPPPRGRTLVLALAGVAALAGLAWAFGLHDLLQIERLARLRQRVGDFGALAPAVYVAGYVVAELLFIPALPLTLLGGLVFGPVWGTAWASVGATLGAAAAFLVARYLARGAVERWVAASPRLQRLDAAVARHDWRILMFTRLVPVFPFTLQNFVYGLTRIGFGRYVVVTWLCALPGTAAYAVAAAAVSEGSGNPRRIVAWLAVAAVLIIGGSLVPRWLRRYQTLGALVIGVGSAAAEDGAAYARLLESHVRPVTISSIRLTAVDYQGLAADPAYARALADLAGARVEALSGDAARIAFWINAYNLLAIKAVVDRYPVKSIRDGGNVLSPIWTRKVGTVAGREYSLDEIEHGILRARFREPRVHMAIVCASLSCPDLRREPYAADRLEVQLDVAARGFLGNPAKGVAPGADGRTARVSSIFKWFAADWGGPDGVVRFIRAKADPDLARRLGGLDARGLSYLDYDWSLNDARRP